MADTQNKNPAAWGDRASVDARLLGGLEQRHPTQDGCPSQSLASHAATVAPTGKGISVAVALIRPLRFALAQADAQAVAQGWPEPEDA